MLKNLKEHIINNWPIILVFGLYVFLHLYKLSSVPYGLHVDEVGMAYDAFNLSKNGFDRYMNSFPVYLINSGGGQSTLYCYICVFLFRFLPLTVFTIRIPAFLNSLIIFIYGSLIIKSIFKTQKIVYLYAILITIMPYFFMSSRIGLDCNLMLGMSIIFLYYFLKAIKDSKRNSYIILGIIGGIFLYSYALSLVEIILFIILIYLYLIYVKKFKFNKFVYFLISIFIISLPLLIFHIVNIFKLGDIKFLNITFNQLPGYRIDEISIVNVIKNFYPVIKSILIHDWINYNSIPIFGTIYYISIIFFIIGFISYTKKFVKKVKRREYEEESIIFIWLLSIFLMGLLLGGDGPNTNKLNSIFFSIVFFTLIGLLKMNSMKNKKISYIVFFIYSFSFYQFYLFYFYEYNSFYYDPFLFESSFEDVLTDLKKDNKLKYRLYYFDTQPIYYFWETKLDADKLKDTDWQPDVVQFKFQNYRFYLPKTVNCSSNYIVKKNNYLFIEQLSSCHLSRKRYKDYYIFLDD